MKKIYTTLSLLLFGFGLLNAQTINTITKNVYQNDTVVLRLNDYIGVIQWQKSADNTNWTDITNANVDTFLFIADQTTYFRAMVTVGNCEPFISDKAEIIISENLAPNTPTSPIPSNGVINQSITPTLGWSCSDPEGDAITYDVYLDANNGTTLVSEGQTDMVYSPIGLSYGTTYYWKIVAKDANDNESTSEVWNFTVIDNLAPNTPTSPIPSNGVTNQSITPTLGWSCSDPEGDAITYDVYLDADSGTTLVSEGQADMVYSPIGLSYGTTYYWKIVAKDANDNESTSEVWNFTVIDNLAPNTPTSPVPSNGVINQSITPTLGWSCSDPEGDAITYDVYLDANNGTTLVSEGQADMVYSPIGLSYGTTYYWKIVAKDANDNESTSEVWNFTVIDNLAPTTEEYKIGMLSVILPENCCIPEGCGPTYKLMYPAPDLNEIYPPFTYIPLLGNISHYHDQLIIKVIGEDTILPPEEYGSMNYYGPTYAIFVQEYELLSQIKYHDFLVPEAKNYTEQTYGCFICWNKTFSWEINGNQSIIKVRLTNTFSAETSLPFIELWYDGNTGQFIKEENNLNGNNPCH